MTTKLEQAARALLAHWDTPAWKYLKPTGDLMADLREALAEQAEQAPVAWMFNVNVEGRANGVFDTANEAVSFARQYVYLRPDQEQQVVDTLNQGQLHTYSYGFSEAHIVPVAKRKLNSSPVRTKDLTLEDDDKRTEEAL